MDLFVEDIIDIADAAATTRSRSRVDERCQIASGSSAQTCEWPHGSGPWAKLRRRSLGSQGARVFGKHPCRPDDAGSVHEAVAQAEGGMETPLARRASS